MARITPAGSALRLTAALALAMALPGCNGSGDTSAAQTPADSLAFAASSYPVAQGANPAVLTVTRADSAATAVSVDYATADGSAQAGKDYTAANGTLRWADGDSTAKTISIAISDATAFSGSKSFSVALSSPTGGATLGSPSSTTVAISGAGGAAPGSVSWVYYNGVFNWGGDYSYEAQINYADAGGGPLSGPYDIAVTITGAYGAFQPYAGGTVPMWNFVDNGYTYLTFAIKPTLANQSAQIYFTQVGDIPVGVDVDPFSGQYGPPPPAGVWSTYKIPLSDLGVANTSVYKFAIQDQTGLNSNVFYLDNIGFE